MTENTSPAKSSVVYGLFFGLIMVLEFVILYVIDIDPISQSWVGVTINTANFLILPLLFIYIAATNFKQNHNDGFITLVDTLKIGVSSLIIGTLIYSAFNIIFQMIFPEYLDEMIDKTRAVMLSKNPEMTSQQLDMALGITKKFMNPWVSLPIGLAIYALLGLIYSVIIGLIIKRERNF